MDPFLSRFYDEVDENLGDPHAQKRLTKAMKYRDLYTVQCDLFERLLALAGQQSSIGITEAAVTLVTGQSFYPLPPCFRQFISLQKWENSDRDAVLLRLESIDSLSLQQGVEILSGQQGMQIKPAPDTSMAGSWMLLFRKGPVKLFYAAVSSFADTSTVVVSAPGADAGEWVKLDNYYTGSLLRIYSAATGAPQTRVIATSTYAAGPPETMTFTLRDALSPTPGASAYAEICPELPDGLDSIYAMDVAIRNTGRRARHRRRAGLSTDRHEIWRACQNYYAVNVADRGPARVIPARVEVDPYEEGYDY